MSKLWILAAFLNFCLVGCVSPPTSPVPPTAEERIEEMQTRYDPMKKDRVPPYDPLKKAEQDEKCKKNA